MSSSQANPGINKIGMSVFDFTNDSIAEFADTLSQYSTQITDVNLNNSLLQSKGASAFGRLLASNSVITSLSLYENLIGLTDQTGFVELSRGLAANTTLKSLDLTKTLMSDEGLNALSAAVSSNSCLTELKLDGNRFTQTGLQVLIDALAANAMHGGRLATLSVFIFNSISDWEQIRSVSDLTISDVSQAMSARSTWFFQSLAQSLAPIGALSPLCTLIVKDALFSLESARAMAAFLRAVPMLTQVRLDNRSVFVKKMKHTLEEPVPELASVLAEQPHTKLYVSRDDCKHVRAWDRLFHP
jgi:hypothetical protein